MPVSALDQAKDAYDYGWNLLHRENYADSIEQFDIAIRINTEYYNKTGTNPTWDKYLKNDKCVALYYLGRYQDALNTCGEAITEYPDYYLAYINKGRALNHLGKPDEGVANIDKGVGLAEKKVQDFKGHSAIDVLEYYYDLANAYFLKGITFEDSERYEEALDYNNKAIATMDMVYGYGEYFFLVYTNYLTEKAYLLGQVGKYPQQLTVAQNAITMLNKSIEIDRDLAANAHPFDLDVVNVWANYGDALQNNERYVDSVAAYDMALSLNRSKFRIWNAKGLSLYKLGRNQEALSAIDTALLLDPTFIDAQENRNLIVSGNCSVVGPGKDLTTEKPSQQPSVNLTLPEGTVPAILGPSGLFALLPGVSPMLTAGIVLTLILAIIVAIFVISKRAGGIPGQSPVKDYPEQNPTRNSGIYVPSYVARNTTRSESPSTGASPEYTPANKPFVIFVSYARKDQGAADAICRGLEKKNFTCWIASRDVKPGEKFTESVPGGILNSNIMLLLLSSDSNTSDHIRRELDLAKSRQIPILAVRLGDVQPSDAISLYISDRQWFSAFPEPVETYIDALAKVIKNL